MYDQKKVQRGLKLLGKERVEQGLTAFVHAPVGNYCNCLATECFRGEIEFVNDACELLNRKQAADIANAEAGSMHHSTSARFIESGEDLDSYGVMEFLHLTKDVGWEEEMERELALSHLFCSAYEEYPEELIHDVVDFLSEPDYNLVTEENVL